jgi:hypothetical protein
MTDTKSDQPRFFGGGNPTPTNESEVQRRAPKLSESHALFEVVTILEQLEDNELRARVLAGCGKTRRRIGFRREAKFTLSARERAGSF